MSECDGKERFATFGLADKVARRRDRNGRSGRPYRCARCSSYHIGGALGWRRLQARHRARTQEEIG